jgi:hypothetical protein
MEWEACLGGVDANIRSMVPRLLSGGRTFNDLGPRHRGTKSARLTRLF